MLNLPIIRWGKPYNSLETANIVHFHTGEPVAEVSQANGGIIQRDMRKAHLAREALRSISASELVARCQQAAHLFEQATLPIGDGQQSPEEFVKMQSATTGMPEVMCRGNMQKISFVLSRMDEILDALTRGLSLDVFTNGFGIEDRGVVVSYQAQTPVLGAVLPSNSPGVHTLWIPAIPLQIGLALKPGSSEPWTPYRITSALVEAGIPAAAIGLYPGGHDAGPALLNSCPRNMIFGSQQTVDQYRGNPAVSVHGPGFSKILFGEDTVDDWRDHFDMMVESIFINGGRSCINCSSIWVPRHAQEIAQALAEKLGPVSALPPDEPNASLAAFTQPAVASAVWNMIENDLKSPAVEDITAAYGTRLVEEEHCSYLRPVIVYCANPEPDVARKEYMFPFASVVECPQAAMLKQIGPTLVGTAVTQDQAWIRQLGDSILIDRLNIGPIATNRLNWLQPHEGNIIDFLYRSRAYQVTDDRLAQLASL